MNDTFCPLPWNHLATHPNGQCTLCCVSDHTNNMSAAKSKEGNYLSLNSSRVFDIVNSDYFINVRKEMRSGIKPQACLRCFREEEMGIQSKRELSRRQFGTNFSDNNGTLEPNLKFIELRLGNVCNVQCRTCNPMSSTKWVSDYSKLQTALPFVTQYPPQVDTNWAHSDAFWDDLLENSKEVELISINGGEPTLVEKHWKYLTRLIDRGYNKQTTLWYNINMTNLPDKLLDIWKHFKKVIVHASIDDLRERNSYIRHGTSWADVESNLQKLVDNKWIQTEITQTVSWMNVFYIDEFLDFFQKANLSVNMNFVHDPKFYSITILSKEIKEIMINRLARTEFTSVLDQLSSNTDPRLLSNGFEYTKWLDTKHNVSFEKTFAPWAKILGYDEHH